MIGALQSLTGSLESVASALESYWLTLLDIRNGDTNPLYALTDLYSLVRTLTDWSL